MAGLLLAATAQAAIRLPSVISSGMVLKQQSTVTLWGWCNPSEEITVSADWLSQPVRCKGTNGATWSVAVPTPSAGGPYTIELKGTHTLKLENVMIGEVWLCSGQSNMEWSGTQKLPQSLEEAPKSSFANIRLFYVAKSTSPYPQDDVPAVWETCGPESMPRFSAVGYFFGKKLHQELKVPIGLIECAWGGTPAEVWTPAPVVAGNPWLRVASERLVKYPSWPRDSGVCYNAMIHPLTPMEISGVIWYQGESNVLQHDSYADLFGAMIQSWRTAWGAPLPFYYVQIAPHTYAQPYVGALLREAQTRCEAIPQTGMAVVSDLVDDVKNIHPLDKRSVGNRLAALALAGTYGRSGATVRSPVYREMAVEGKAVRIRFDRAESGLVSRGGAPTDFEIAGPDRKFVPATAVIERDTVVVSAEGVDSPRAVRFGFSNESMPNLFAANGLPVNLFRTDDWAIDTTRKN